MKELTRGQWHVWFGLAAAGWFATFAFFPELYRAVGVLHYGVWFLDSFAILASNDAVARGLDPVAPNALDYFNRPHVYTHWWLGLRHLGLTRAHNFTVGVVVVAAFFVAAVAFLRPRGLREALWYLAILGSSPVLLAVNRANNDLVIFALLAPVVPCLLDGRRVVRMAAIALIAVAAGLKFFPAAAGLVLLAGVGVTTREVRERLGLAVLALAVVGVSLAQDLAAIGKLAPKATGLMTFAAANLPAELGLTGFYGAAFTVAGMAAVGAFFWRVRWFDGWVIAPSETGVWLSFVLGAVLLAGCFFTGTNYAYRWVFAVWLAPLLWRLPREAAAPVAVRRFAAVTAGLLMVGLWADPLLSAVLGALAERVPLETAKKIAGVFFAVEQPLTWAFFACLLGWLTYFTREGVRRVLGREGGG